MSDPLAPPNTGPFQDLARVIGDGSNEHPTSRAYSANVGIALGVPLAALLCLWGKPVLFLLVLAIILLLALYSLVQLSRARAWCRAVIATAARAFGAAGPERRAGG